MRAMKGQVLGGMEGLLELGVSRGQRIWNSNDSRRLLYSQQATAKQQYQGDLGGNGGREGRGFALREMQRVAKKGPGAWRRRRRRRRDTKASSILEAFSFSTVFPAPTWYRTLALLNLK
jgi:hypothetical protein